MIAHRLIRAGLGAWVGALAGLVWLTSPTAGITQQSEPRPTPAPRPTYNNNRYGSGSSYGSGSTYGTGSQQGWNRDSSSFDRDRRSSRDSDTKQGEDTKSSSASRKKASDTPAKAGDAKATLRTAPPKSGGQGKVSGAGSSSGSKAQSTLNEFQLLVNKEAFVLYLDPPDATVGLGEKFNTSVLASNPAGHRFDEIRLALRYDRDVVKPVSYEDRALKRFLAEPSKLAVYPQEGMVVYSAKLASPFSGVADALFVVRWEALQLTKRADFQFAPYQDKPNGAWMGAVDVLGAADTPGDGLINGSVQIVSPDVMTKLKNSTTRGYAGVMVDEIELTEEKAAGTGGVKLHLKAPDKPVRVGDDFTVDIVLDNTADSLLDRIDVYLQYDPEILQVVDTDKNNWMTRGVNIWDGPYHSRFPFDYHIENQVFTGRGEIVYRMGIGDPERLRHRAGTLATVRFRALAPSPSTAVGFRVSEQDYAPGTRLKYLNESVLGDGSTAGAGLKDVALRVYN